MNSLSDVNWPPIAAAEGTHAKTLEILHELGLTARAKVLDMPCGAGAFASAAEQLGFDVTGLDIHPNEPYYGKIDKRILGDANKGLPFEDDMFDAVCSIEGIEHLENPSFFLRELCRVTKPGGYCILSTPNVDSYRSRRNLFFKRLSPLF